MTTYYSIAGQSIYDVCLQTYGSMDFVYKLMQDNAFLGLDATVSSGQPFLWDSSLVVGQQLYQQNVATGTLYATSVSSLGSVFYVVNNGNSIVTPGNGQPYNPPSPVKKQQMVLGTSYTSSVDNTTVVNPVDINGNPLTGFDIVQIEKEIKPLKASQYVWNSALNTLTLIGITVDQNESLFILYSKLV